MKAALLEGNKVLYVYKELAAAFLHFGGVWAAWSSCAGRPLRPRDAGCADHGIFPLPWLSLSVAQRGRRREVEMKRRGECEVTNLWLFALNVLYLGEEWELKGTG